MIYVIDSSCLIDASKSYTIGKKSFESVWNTIDTLIQEKKLISSSEIKDEILDEDLLQWLKKYDNFYIPLTEAIQLSVITILKKYPSLIKLRSSGNSNADPFLIATALEFSKYDIVKVVSNEKPSGDRIPVVCNHYGIECISLSKFINEVIE